MLKSFTIPRFCVAPQRGASLAFEVSHHRSVEETVSSILVVDSLTVKSRFTFNIQQSAAHAALSRCRKNYFTLLLRCDICFSK